MRRPLARRRFALRAVAALLGATLAAAPAPGATAGRVGAADRAGCAGADMEAARQSPARRHAAMRCLINRRRARAGVRLVRSHARVARAASGHTADMVRRGYFAHVTPGGRGLGDRLRAAGVPFRRAGEVLAWNCGGATPRAAVRAWMRSAPHRKVILDGRYALVGVGTAPRTPAGCRGGATWTVVFARLL